MRNTHTFGIQFILRMNKIKDDKAPTYARITVDLRRVEISMKRTISLNDWSIAKGEPKGTREEIRTLNRFLADVKAKITRCHQEMLLQGQPISAEAIKNKFLGADQKRYTLSMLMEYHNVNMKDSLEWGTLKNYFTTQKYLQMFVKERYKLSDFNLSQLSYKFITEFEYFLRNHQPVDHQKPLGNNGVMKHIERLRKMVNMAVRLEWLERDPFAKYRLRFDKVERDFLTKDELRMIEQREFSLDRLNWIRDLFIFSCHTGLAYIDVMRLKPANIGLGIDGEYWITTKRKKTSNPVRVPLLPKALAIMEKYKSNPKAVSEGTLFPTISNQKLNNYLKEIAFPALPHP